MNEMESFYSIEHSDVDFTNFQNDVIYSLLHMHSIFKMDPMGKNISDFDFNSSQYVKDFGKQIMEQLISQPEFKSKMQNLIYSIEFFFHKILRNYFFINSSDFLHSIFREFDEDRSCLLYTSPSPRDLSTSRMPSSA